MPTTTWANSTSTRENLLRRFRISNTRRTFDPSSYDNGYDLAMAYLLTGQTVPGASARSKPAETERYCRTAQPARPDRREGRQVRGLRSNEFETAAHRIRAKAISSIGPANCCCTARSSRPFEVFQTSRPSAIRIRREWR